MENTFECLKCQHISPLNLEFIDSIDKNAGGELYIQKKHIEDPKSRAIIHNLFAAVGILWDIWLGFLNSGNEKLKSVGIVHMHLWAAINDLKTSAYLILSGRYREAYIMLRSALDLYVYGLYFESRLEEAKSDEEKTEIDNEYIAWQKGDRENFPSFRRSVNNIKNINKDLKEELKDMYFKLSNIAHTWKRSDVERILEDKVTRSVYHAFSAYFNYEELKEVYREFLTVVKLIKETLIYWLQKIEVLTHLDKKLKQLDEILSTATEKEPRPIRVVDCKMLSF